jgi:hypothetical protein
MKRHIVLITLLAAAWFLWLVPLACCQPKNLGLRDALNLDGGASTGLYYNGEYVTAPGRLLSNCLAVIIK